MKSNPIFIGVSIVVGLLTIYYALLTIYSIYGISQGLIAVGFYPTLAADIGHAMIYFMTGKILSIICSFCLPILQGK